MKKYRIKICRKCMKEFVCETNKIHKRCKECRGIKNFFKNIFKKIRFLKYILKNNEGFISIKLDIYSLRKIIGNAYIDEDIQLLESISNSLKYNMNISGVHRAENYLRNILIQLNKTKFYIKLRKKEMPMPKMLKRTVNELFLESVKRNNLVLRVPTQGRLNSW